MTEIDSLDILYYMCSFNAHILKKSKFLLINIDALISLHLFVNHWPKVINFILKLILEEAKLNSLFEIIITNTIQNNNNIDNIKVDNDLNNSVFNYNNFVDKCEFIVNEINSICSNLVFN